MRMREYHTRLILLGAPSFGDMETSTSELKDVGQNVKRKNSVYRLRSLNVCPCVAARYMLAVLAFWGFLNVYALRVNLSVAIVLMDNTTSTDRRHAAPAFKWSDTEQGWILAAFFYGYVLTQIPGGLLAERIGGKWVFGVGVVMTSVLTLFTPLAAFTNVWFLVVVRVLEGFFEGVTFPAMYALWGKWAPPGERSRLVTISIAGVYFGNLASFPLSALLCQYGFDGGWPSVFYVFGAGGLVWFVLWAMLAHSTPAKHPRISPKERLYIESSLAMENSKPKKRTPWRSIFTSLPVWGLIICYLCDGWGFYVLLTCMPTFIQQTLGCSHSIPIVMNGVYSAIPYTLLFVVVMLTGPVSDYIRSHWLSRTVSGKIFAFAGLTVPAVSLVLCGYLGSSMPLAILFLTLGVGLNGLTFGGYKVNQLDIAASQAGALSGITNTFANVPGIVSPQITKLIAKTPDYPKCSDEYTSTLTEEWRQVFIITAELYLFGAIVYLFLGSGKKQSWAEETEAGGEVLATASTPSINFDGERKPLLAGKENC